MVPLHPRTRYPRIFVVDDQQPIADSIVRILTLRGYEAHARYSSSAILELASELPPDLLIADVALDPNSINGIDLAIYVQRFYPDCRIILISGNPDSFELHNHARLEGHDYLLLAKPVPPERLLNEVAIMLDDREHAA